MDEAHLERVAKNQALFRDVNERVADIAKAHSIPTDEVWDFLCECASTDCTERIALTHAEYEAIRTNAAHFAVVAGHELPEVERVVRREPAFVVVAKVGAGEALAEKLDPRSARAPEESDPPS